MIDIGVWVNSHDGHVLNLNGKTEQILWLREKYSMHPHRVCFMLDPRQEISSDMHLGLATRLQRCSRSL